MEHVRACPPLRPWRPGGRVLVRAMAYLRQLPDLCCSGDGSSAGWGATAATSSSDPPETTAPAVFLKFLGCISLVTLGMRGSDVNSPVQIFAHLLIHSGILLLYLLLYGSKELRHRFNLLFMRMFDIDLLDLQSCLQFITEVRDFVTCVYSMLRRKAVMVGLIVLLLSAIGFGALDLVLNHSLDTRRASDNTILHNYYDESHGRMLLAYNQDKRDQASVGKDIIISVVIASVIFVVVCFVAALLWYKCRNRARQNQPQAQIELCRVKGPRPFKYDELAAATNNFSDENKLGRGGFGPVYQGFLKDPDRHVAVKLLSAESSGQGKKEFETEIIVLTQLRHRNVLQLVGWCDSNEGLLLVYELMAEGSLDKHLYNPVRILSWQQRYKIIVDVGAALLYLHQCCDKCIVHGDIKPENVMLDASFNAKLGDFGTARLIEHGAEPRATEIVAGTRGYIDPEFVNNHLRCPVADMYSFGVTLLEIASGKRPASRQPDEASPLLVWVRDLYDRRMVLDAADAKMNGEFDRQQMERVLVTGLWCAHPDPSQRPSIEQAMDALRDADEPFPKLPATRDPQLFRILEEQAYGDLTGEGASVDAVAGSTSYITSKDESAYLLC